MFRIIVSLLLAYLLLFFLAIVISALNNKPPEPKEIYLEVDPEEVVPWAGRKSSY